MSYLAILALVAGAAIATQASINAQLGVMLKSSLLGTTVAFSCSFLFTLLAVIASTKHYPQAEEIRSIPVYFWFAGGALSAFGVALFYYLIPKMGVGPMMSYALTGQMVIAVIASHFGWFDLPVKHIQPAQLIGLIALINGVILINLD